ncbi:hypothetical protein RAA17_19780 [Komagataeibacter rhaeticus]|nr:hypothetical protein [Komagataeibacter rhaeticus]
MGRIPARGMETVVEASDAECRRLATRLGIPGLRNLSCRYRLAPGRDGEVLAEGWLTAHVTQECVVSLEPFEDVLAESFTVRCIPAERFREDDEIDPFSVDEVPYARDSIDLGNWRRKNFRWRWTRIRTSRAAGFRPNLPARKRPNPKNPRAGSLFPLWPS